MSEAIPRCPSPPPLPAGPDYFDLWPAKSAMLAGAGDRLAARDAAGPVEPDSLAVLASRLLTGSGAVCSPGSPAEHCGRSACTDHGRREV